MCVLTENKKALSKFATVALAAHDMLGDKPLAVAGLAQLKIAFARFSENQQQYPLVYESVFFYSFFFFFFFVLFFSPSVSGSCSDDK